jgi:hypothetical protein
MIENLAVPDEPSRAGVNKSFRATKQFLGWFTSHVDRDDPLE